MQTPASNRIFRAVWLALLLFLSAAAQAQNPVPQIVGPVEPMTVAPGSGAFTLNVYGANFVQGAVVNWNYQPRTTTFVSAHELQAQILSTDVEQNTAGFITVTNPSPGGGDSSSSWAQVEVHDAITAFTFGPPATSVGGGWLLLPADFNHNTLLDLVAQTGTSLVLSDEESGGIFQFASVVGYFYSGDNGGTYGDFNNDGLLDVAYVAGVPASDSTQMNIILGESNGQFRLGSQIKGNHVLNTVVTGDFNRDGNLDLVSSGEASTHVYLGNGDGSFTHLKDYPYRGSSLVTADFNGDGKLDIAEVDNTADGFSVNVYYGKGDGTFLPTPQTVATTAPGVGPCGFINFLAVSDFNGDGLPDLVFCTKSQIGILINEGKGVFQQPTYIDIDLGTGGFFTFATGDLNADGKTDLMASEQVNGETAVFSVFLGNGDGTFQPPQTIPFRLPFIAELGFVVADFGSIGTLGIAVPSDNSQTFIFTQ